MWNILINRRSAIRTRWFIFC